MSTSIPARFKIEGVPPVGWYSNAQKLDKLPRCPESIFIPSTIRSIMRYLGEGLGCQKARMPGYTGDNELACGYSFLMGVSGAAFYTCWDDHWLDDCVSIAWLGHDFETAERRCFSALGYSYAWILRKEGADNQADWLGRIVESLRGRHMPVLSYGIIGPPEPSIITGWDEGGTVLMGWSYFQEMPEYNAGVEFEPEGQFRKRNWMEGNLCLLVIGEKKPRPDIRQVYRDSLEWGLKVFRTPKVFPEPDAPNWVATKWNGLAALKAWEESLLDGASFPGDEATLRHHHAMHNSVAGNLAEERLMADVYLQQIAARVPSAAPELIQAGRLYQNEHDLTHKLWGVCGGADKPEEYQRLADPGVRRDLAAVIVEMRAKEEQATGLIEQALAKWD